MKIGKECLRLLFISGLLFNIAKAGPNFTLQCGSDPSDYRLPVTVTECRHYNVQLIVPEIDQDKYLGKVKSIIEIHKTTRNISLHSDTRALLPDTILTRHSDNEQYTPVRYIYCHVTEILTISFETDLSPGNYTLEMKFESMLDGSSLKGLVRMKYENDDGKKKTFYMTHFHWAARRVFPCFDEPGLRATFNISVKHGRSYKALSNMPMQRIVGDGEMMWTHFHTTPLIPPYLVAVVLFDNFTAITYRNTSITVWGRPKVINDLQYAQYIAQIFTLCIRWYTNYTVGVPKMDHVEIPSSFLTSEPYWGLYTYEESTIAYNPSSAFIDQEYTVALRIAHTIAYQWFHSMVSPSWWSYMWLNVGITQFLEFYITDKIFPQSRTIDYYVVNSLQRVLSKDVGSLVTPIMRKVNTPNEITYLSQSDSQKKAIAIIRMMNHILTDQVFRKGIQIYLQKHRFKTATPDDFWNALQEALKESTDVFEKVEFKTVMVNWLSSSNYPVVKVTRTPKRLGIVRIRQEPFYVQEGDEENNTTLWWIPITYTTQSYCNFSNTLPSVWLTPSLGLERIIYNIPEDDWIIVNLQQTGYYRVNYEINNWRKLVAYLNSDEYTKIHPINRAQLIDDSYHLMLAGHLDSSIFVELTGYLKREIDYIPWQSTRQILSHMSKFFNLSENSPFLAHIRGILNDCLKYVGYKENNYDTTMRKRLRLTVLQLACGLNNTECLQMATAKLNAFLEDPETHVISSSWRDWTLCLGMIRAKASSWTKVLDIYLRTKDDKYLGYLNCAEEPSIINDYIDKLVSHEIPVMVHEDRLHIMFYIIRKHASKDSVLDHILTNYDRISSLYEFSIIEAVLINMYDPKQFEKVKKFVTNRNIDMNEVWPNRNSPESLTSYIERQSNQIQAEANTFTSLLNISRN